MMMAGSAVKVRSQAPPSSPSGQQVTCYPHNDTNNHWQVLPTKEIPDTGRGRVVRHNDVIQLLHLGTQTLLLTHDVASPLMPTNQEFTTVEPDEEERRNDTLFQIQVNDAHEGEAWNSLSGQFKLVHMPTKVLLWTHPSPLPEWAYNQQEVNGNKNAGDRTTSWYVDNIIADGTGNDFRNRTVRMEPKSVKGRSFIKKFVELHILMLQHNAGLTASHPYASNPIEWPFCLSGISFWTDGAVNQQIYMIGNLLGWWVCAVAVSVFVGIIGADMLARRRGLDPIEDGESRLTVRAEVRYSQSAVQKYRLLPRNMGVPLLSLLPNVPPTIPTPLPTRASRIRASRRISPKLHPHRDRQLSCLRRWPANTSPPRRTCADGWRFLGCHTRIYGSGTWDVLVHCAVDIWYNVSNASRFSIRC